MFGPNLNSEEPDWIIAALFAVAILLTALAAIFLFFSLVAA